MEASSHEMKYAKVFKSNSLSFSNFLKKSRPLNLTDLAEIWHEG